MYIHRDLNFIRKTIHRRRLDYAKYQQRLIQIREYIHDFFGFFIVFYSFQTFHDEKAFPIKIQKSKEMKTLEPSCVYTLAQINDLPPRM